MTLNLDKNLGKGYKNRHIKSPKKKFMRFITTLIILGGLGYGGYWVHTNKPEYKHKALEMIYTSSVNVLEPRYSEGQIIEKEKLGYVETELLLHPYLLMEVKYSLKDTKTEEGVILWDLIDGEMVTNTQNWDKTHGFADCITAHADWHEYMILKTIAQNKGKADRQTLMNSLKLDSNLLSAWLDRAQKKKLIVQHNNLYRIHLSEPQIDVKPATSTSIPLVTKSQKHSELMTRRFTSKQIVKASEAAFGSDFAIRSTQEIFLPIYSITIKNSDGSLQTTHWNAFNGKVVP